MQMPCFGHLWAAGLLHLFILIHHTFYDGIWDKDNDPDRQQERAVDPQQPYQKTYDERTDMKQQQTAQTRECVSETAHSVTYGRRTRNRSLGRCSRRPTGSRRRSCNRGSVFPYHVLQV